MRFRVRRGCCWLRAASPAAAAAAEWVFCCSSMEWIDPVDCLLPPMASCRTDPVVRGRDVADDAAVAAVSVANWRIVWRLAKPWLPFRSWFMLSVLRNNGSPSPPPPPPPPPPRISLVTSAPPTVDRDAANGERAALRYMPALARLQLFFESSP